MSGDKIPAKWLVEIVTGLDVGSMFFYGKEKVYGSIP
jgi:hypothetical protein